MKKIKFLITLFSLFSLSSCLADTNPPDSARYTGEMPALYLSVTGDAGTKFFLSFTDSAGQSYTFTDSSYFRIAQNGELVLFFEFDREVDQLSQFSAALQTESNCVHLSCSCRIENQQVSIGNGVTSITIVKNDTSTCTALVLS